MTQPIRKGAKVSKAPSKKTAKRKPSGTRHRRWHPKYGTSKLEEKFAKEFLDKLGAEYVYQFEAESIGRYFDFYLPDENIIIEVDGDYWHSYGVLEEDMTPTQKKNRRVDEQKEHWALIHGIKLIRIWEHDINKHPSSVMDRLKGELSCAKSRIENERNKKKRH